MARYREIPNPHTGIIARQKLCEGKRRDGAMCNALALKDQNYCSNHGGKPVNPKFKAIREQKAIYAIRIYPAIIARAPEHVKQTKEFKLVSSTGSKKYMAQVCLAYEKFAMSQDSTELRAELDDIVSRFNAMIAREQKTMERRYRERELQGIPHPENRAKW